MLLAVSSPARVVYSCPQLNNRWDPAFFTLQVNATAGPNGCSGRASATANVRITSKPVLTWTVPAEPTYVCEDSTNTAVTVPFSVSTDNGAEPIVPDSITATDGRVCTKQANASSRKFAKVQLGLLPCSFAACCSLPKLCLPSSFTIQRCHTSSHTSLEGMGSWCFMFAVSS
jgi:hypothetical protein